MKEDEGITGLALEIEEEEEGRVATPQPPPVQKEVSQSKEDVDEPYWDFGDGGSAPSTEPQEKGRQNQSPQVPSSQPALPVAEQSAETAPESDEQAAKKARIKNGHIGEQLIARGLINEDQLNVALQEKKMTGKLTGEVLVDLGFIDEQELMTFLAESAGHEMFDPKRTLLDGEALDLLDKNTAVKLQVLPISITEDAVVIAMVDPYDVMAMDALRRFIPKGKAIKPLLATPADMNEAVDNAYGYASTIKGILKELEEGSEAEDVASLNEEEAYSHPIVRLVNALVYEAVKIGASDIHFEPEENFVRLRYRKDGVLYTAQTLHKQHWSAIAQRLKIISGMNIADKLSPQDGRFSINAGGRMADFRVSSLPTVHGENIVLRILDQSQSIKPLASLGFSDENFTKIKKAQSRPEGIIIVTGPTGSGKSTSLYSMLNEINDVDINIQTLEDPVEYSIPMIRQTPIREGVLDFADGIKALLRQDPDIIFIGEIRDPVTAEMALKAAMTGHQVYTTLHTNDAFGAIPRLLDLELKPGMIAGAIVAVFAQRLVRLVCKSCRQAYLPDEQECAILGIDPMDKHEIFRAQPGGCEACGGNGYSGRTAVAEILLFDEDLDEVVANNGSKAQLKAMAVEKGFKNMRDDGILKILDGITTLDALAKVVSLNG